MVKLSVPFERLRQRGERWTPVLLGIATATYVLVTTYLSVRRHAYFQTHAFDMGIFESAFFNTISGHHVPFFSSLVGGSQMGVHPSFILYLLLPFYWLVPRAETLFLAQSLLIGLAAYPLFLVGRELRLSTVTAGFVALTYLLHPAVAGANLFDFHELCFFPLIFFSLVLTMLRRHWLAWPLLLALMAVKDDAPLASLALGIFFCSKAENRKWGGAMALLSIAGFWALRYVRVGWFEGTPNSHVVYFANLAPETGTFSELLKNGFTHPGLVLREILKPEKGLFLLTCLLGPSLLILLDWRAWIPAIYGVALALLASSPAFYSFGFAYSLYLVVPAILGGALVLSRQKSAARQRVALAVSILGTLLLTSRHGLVSPLGTFQAGFDRLDLPQLVTGPTPLDRSRAILDRIPARASVVASEQLVPHVAKREDLGTLRYASMGIQPDFLLIALNERNPKLLEMIDRFKWRHVGENEYLVLLQRAVSTPPSQ